MAWPEPASSRNQIRLLGKRIVAAHQARGILLWGIDLDGEDYQRFQNWRASHGAVLNTAQAWLRRLSQAEAPIVGQRLKRLDTIVDKLVTGRSRDLSTMNDIAGVRAIFRSEEKLLEFRGLMDCSRAKHSLTHDLDKFNYIEEPKNTGYRGIHLVYSRFSPSFSGQPWNGLKFEVQLRTAVQHAWATAIEVYDSTRRERFKFEESADPAYFQFQIVSEIFSRIYEERNSCLRQHTDIQLVDMFEELEVRTRMLASIKGLVVAKNAGVLKSNTILQKTKDGSLKIYRYETFPKAIAALPRIEGLAETENAVLVGATTPNHIRDAFRNYFDDTTDFVKLLEDAIAQIRENN